MHRRPQQEAGEICGLGKGNGLQPLLLYLSQQARQHFEKDGASVGVVACATIVQEQDVCHRKIPCEAAIDTVRIFLDRVESPSCP